MQGHWGHIPVALGALQMAETVGYRQAEEHMET